MFRKVYFSFLLILLSGQFLYAAGERPQLLVFLGPKECPWTHFFLQNVVDQEKWNDRLSSQVELRWVNFTDHLLRERYQVEQFPTFLLLSPARERWSTMPFVPVEGGCYVEKIEETLSFKNLFHSLSLPACDLEDLQELYLKAKELYLSQDALEILEEGAKRGEGVYFLLEKYALLIEKKRRRDPEVDALREKILARDPKNKEGSLFRLALIEFESGKKRGSLKKPRKIAAPLVDYVKTHKESDKENLWKAEMLIARYFLHKNKRAAALRHAHKALAAAPSEMQPAVEAFIALCSKE